MAGRFDTAVGVGVAGIGLDEVAAFDHAVIWQRSVRADSFVRSPPAAANAALDWLPHSPSRTIFAPSMRSISCDHQAVAFTASGFARPSAAADSSTIGPRSESRSRPNCLIRADW